MASLMAVAPSSGAVTVLNDPLKMAQGVRTADTMYASWISFGLRDDEENCLETAWRRCEGDDMAVLGLERRERRRADEAMVVEERE